MDSTETHLPNDAISFQDSLLFFWQARFHMLGGLIAGLVLATFFLALSHPAFEASISVAPPNISLPGSSMPGGDVDTGGLSGLLGLKGANDGPSTYDRAIFMFHSRELAEKLSNNPAIMHTIFAGQWDNSRQQWAQRWGLGTALHNLVSWMFGRGGWVPPSPDELSDYIQASVLLKPADQHGVTIITYRNTDARFARYFLEKLVLTADGSMREGDRQRYEQYQSFLIDRIAKTESIDVRQSLIALFSAVTQRLMLISSKATYAMDILDGAKVTARPVTPSISLTYMIFAMIGIAAGAALAIAGASGILPEFKGRWRPIRS